jgi:hypothetical protein
MRLCDDGHDEVCYACRDCPVCEAREEIARHEAQAEENVKQIEALKDEIRELKNPVELEASHD